MSKPQIRFRLAEAADLPAIVGLLADDPLGAKRERLESPLPPSYRAAFDTISHDPNNELMVAVSNDAVVGVLQLTFIPGMTYQGGWRALIEAVRVAAPMRSQGIGQAMFEWAIQRARERGCVLVQLTTDRARADALRFYERLGFVASHHGLKLRF